MKVKELMEILSDFDPDCAVEVSMAGDEWAWDEVNERSYRNTYASFQTPDSSDIELTTEGIVRLGKETPE